MALLSVQHLVQRYGNKTILRNITLAAKSGSIVALLGPNGAGKTTLLRTVMGLLPLSLSAEDKAKVSVHFDGASITGWPVHQRVAAGIVYLAQHCTLFSSLSVYENLLLVYEYHEFWQSADGGKERFLAEMDRWLTKTTLLKSLHLPAGALSGGQKRKLEVVRSLLLRPRLIMLDEPFAGVDPKSIYELKEIFCSLAKDDIAVMISDHHVDQLLSIADHIYVVCNGTIVASGDIAAIMENSYTRQMYLGGQFHEEMAKRFLS